MKRDEFAQLVDGFRLRPVIPPGGQRHVYLWHGELAALQPLLARANVLELDLHALTRALLRRPSDVKAARGVLEDAVTGWLRDHATRENEQQIIVVHGCDLLMRYQVSLGTLMQYAADNRMIVLVAPIYREPSAPLPGYVDYRATASLDYLTRFVADACIVG